MLPGAKFLSENCTVLIHILWLVGGFKDDFYFPWYMGCHPSHWRTPSFFRGVGQPPTRWSWFLYDYFWRNHKNKRWMWPFVAPSSFHGDLSGTLLGFPPLWMVGMRLERLRMRQESIGKRKKMHRLGNLNFSGKIGIYMDLSSNTWPFWCFFCVGCFIRGWFSDICGIHDQRWDGMTMGEF